MDYFNTGLDTLKIFLTVRGTERTSLNLTVYLPRSFTFTAPLISHFVFWSYPTAISILHSSMLVKVFFVYVMCDDLPLYPNHYSTCYSFIINKSAPHNVSPINRFSTLSSFCFFPTKNQLPCVRFFHSFGILC